MLTIKLAKEAVFGEVVMRRCIPGGTRELTALPSMELYELKRAVSCPISTLLELSS